MDCPEHDAKLDRGTRSSKTFATSIRPPETLNMALPRPSKIVCIGRNYLDHAKELGNEPPKEPLVFLKPPSSLIDNGQPIRLHEMSKQIEYEGEIGIIIGKRISRVDE